MENDSNAGNFSPIPSRTRLADTLKFKWCDLAPVLHEIAYLTGLDVSLSCQMIIDQESHPLTLGTWLRTRVTFVSASDRKVSENDLFHHILQILLLYGSPEISQLKS